MKTIKTPGPDHPISVRRLPARVVVRAGGIVVADSIAVIELKEASYPAVYYIPRQDVDMARLAPTAHATYCPYKGDCSYFSMPMLGERGENAVWSYAEPYEAVREIKEHLAFYPDRMDAIEVMELY
jgi:uncharacterized protein (DUF427 family)